MAKSTTQQRKVQIAERLRKKLAVKQGEKKICLTMIVRNESKNMPRVLDSIKSKIDMISIVDTGSTDNTEEVIMNWGKEHNIPTKVHHEPFQNFAYNRTHSVKIAKQTFPEAHYFLLSDADFIWETDVGGTFDKELLIDHKYLVEQYNKALRYWNIRLLSAKVEWECLGVTHEYWTEKTSQSEYMGEIRTAKISTLVINDKEDGGHKADKFDRDERLLRWGLNDPDTKESLKTRYKFYLGQTLKDMGRFEESIEWYYKRSIDRGWPEEVFYSKFQIGYNYEQLAWNTRQVITLMAKDKRTDDEIKFLAKWNKDNLDPAAIKEKSDKYFTEAGVNYMAAYKYRKTRSESLYYLVRMYRSLGMNELAFNLAIEGREIPYPTTDTLFIEKGCYDYYFDFEISIVAFYVKDKKDVGRASCAKLINRKDIPEWMMKILENNSRHYI